MFRKKSQISVIDLVISLFISTILIVFIILAWNRYVSILNEENEYNTMEIIGFQAADLLVKSRGEPENWDEMPTNVNNIGLASLDRRISTAKLEAFLNLSYNISSKSLGTDLYDFYFQLKSINGSRIAEYGKSPKNTVVNIPRLVLYKDEKAIVEFAIWR